jgi:hypothetical protein
MQAQASRFSASEGASILPESVNQSFIIWTHAFDWQSALFILKNLDIKDLSA